MTSFFTRKRLAASAVVIVVLGGAVAAASARSESGPSYRTARASMEAVDQELSSVGTVEPVSQASVAFPVAGTVEAVDVMVGQEVTVGTPLATLDVGDLEVTLHEKQAALDQAELVLQMALDGEDVSAVSGGGTPSGGFGRPAASDTNAELEAAQQAVLDAQQAVDDATAAADVAYNDAVTACGGTNTAACLAALQAVQAAQAQVTVAQQQLTDAADALTALLDELANATTTTTTTPTTTPASPPPPTTAPAATPSPSVPSGGSSLPNAGNVPSDQTSASPSAEDLIAYQKAVDAAEDELAVAQQAIDQATVVSPIDGRIASVGVAAGDEVEAASATANIVVVGNGGFEVTTSVSVKDLPDLEVGQAAMVTPDGADEAIEGQIVRIGVTADTSGSSATYAVTIGITGDATELGNGSTATVVIVTAAADDALAVPTSAVTVDGDRSTVRRVTDGTAKETTVKTGAVGSTWTEITDGLEKGDEVVLAQMDEPLPGSATDTSSKGQDQVVQFPGGGSFTLPGGGAPPAGARPGN